MHTTMKLLASNGENTYIYIEVSMFNTIASTASIFSVEIKSGGPGYFP